MIAFTTLCYSLGKQHGVINASNMIDQWLQAGECRMPWMYTLKRLQSTANGIPIAVYHDVGGSHLAQARSRAFHWARMSGADVWITCDDDVEIDSVAARELLAALDTPEPRVVAVPTLLRGSAGQVDVQFRGETGDNGLRPIQWSGLGCVGANRAAIDQLAATHPQLVYTGEMGPGMVALFHELLAGGAWYGEDVSFWLRVPTAQRFAITTGTSTHDGATLDLEAL